MVKLCVAFLYPFVVVMLIKYLKMVLKNGFEVGIAVVVFLWRVEGNDLGVELLLITSQVEIRGKGIRLKWLVEI